MFSSFHYMNTNYTPCQTFFFFWDKAGYAVESHNMFFLLRYVGDRLQRCSFGLQTKTVFSNSILQSSSTINFLQFMSPIS